MSGVGVAVEQTVIPGDQEPVASDDVLDTPGPLVKQRRWTWSDVIAPIIGFGVFVGLWYLMSYWALEHLWDKPQFLIPPPHTVLHDSFFDSVPRQAMLSGLWYTTIVALYGLLIAIVIGMSLAIIMAQARPLERAAWPYLVAVQAVPIIALVPIIGSIFGYGRAPRVFVCVIISIFPIVSSTLFGLLSAERGQHDLFTLRGASRWTRLWKLQLPNALPSIFNGFRVAAGLSVVGAVVGELFFVRGEKGIGILMQQYRSRNIYPLTYGCLALAALLGIAVFILFGVLGNLVVGRWYESTRKG
jgi:NitT/TauT family transport system permease protein